MLFGCGMLIATISFFVVGSPDTTLKAFFHAAMVGFGMVVATPFILQPRFIPREHTNIRNDYNFHDIITLTVVGVLLITLFFLMRAITPRGVVIFSGGFIGTCVYKAQQWAGN